MYKKYPAIHTIPNTWKQKIFLSLNNPQHVQKIVVSSDIFTVLQCLSFLC